MRVGIAMIEGYRFTLEPVFLGFDGLAATARKLEGLGFDGIISSETAGHDPFFPLLIAAEHTERVQLTTGVAVSFPRSPMSVAQMAWDLQRLSGGRFALGLGTQVKGHNERRYGTPWTGPPGPRMREYIQCLQAIFRTFQNRDEPSYFEGEHYRFTLLPPVFSPEPIEHPQIPIYTAAVNPYMSRLAGEICQGVFAHPVCTARYMREVMLPSVEAGAKRAGRDPSEIEIIGAPIIVTGRNTAELRKERELLKRRVAFYASTRSYARVFEVHGWEELGSRLHHLSLDNRWDEMAKLIPDEMADEFATIAPIDEIGPRLRERWGSILTTLNFPTDFPLATSDDEKRTQEILQALQ
ncbi:MAG: LLM class F420-dependent oxidoreductase [Deltaproteobacteria bacterium]|jgi:probable F420-dependent oxidoreductase|nr:LLM class F420-dependent oxidoreductase [Deltaproteobacteria bacterium]